MPPEDDGGTPITSYLVRYMDIDSGEWVTACTSSTPNATATGLKPGHLYQFEVSAINKEGQSEPIFTGDPILAENPYRPPSAPGEPKIVDFDNKSVTLRWENPSSQEIQSWQKIPTDRLVHPVNLKLSILITNQSHYDGRTHLHRRSNLGRKSLQTA